MKQVNFLITLILPIFLFLFGCVTTQQIQEKRVRFNSTIPICNDEQDCQEKWTAAQVWVVRNCGMKIQIATNSIIETYTPTGSTTKLAARVVKEPIGSGRYKILVSTWCDNIFGCNPDSWDAAINFNEYVGRF